MRMGEGQLYFIAGSRCYPKRAPIPMTLDFTDYSTVLASGMTPLWQKAVGGAADNCMSELCSGSRPSFPSISPIPIGLGPRGVIARR